MKSEEDVARIMVVSSNNLVRPQTFDNAAINVNFVVARSLVEGITQLEKWAKEGHAADIVDIEQYPGVMPNREVCDEEIKLGEAIKLHFSKHHRTIDDYEGDDAIRFFIDWSQENLGDTQIRKFFLNTLLPDEFEEDELSERLGVPVSVHHTREFNDIFLYGRFGSKTRPSRF